MPRSVIPATILVALLLTGCSSTGSPIETTEAAQPSRSASASPTPAVDDMEACRQLSTLFIPTQDIVSAVVAEPSGTTIDKAQLKATADSLRAVDEVASSKMRVYLAPFSSVVLIIDDVWNARIDPPDSLDTGAYRDAAIDILSYCADTVGYRAS